ncbi:MAG: UDP-N-acetylmuramoyl-L-alanine--D-glutamate ligase [Bdellovibrionales bacterium]
MKLSDLQGKKIVIWGAGREGLAAAKWLREQGYAFKIIDEADQAPSTEKIIHHSEDLNKAVDEADVVIKSPGVSLYHPLLMRNKARGLVVTSLLNLWCGESSNARIIAVTGTKGKSTTASLLHHVLLKLGKRSLLLGNIGVPVTEASQEDADFVVVEVSSYQAANFDGMCEIGVMTSLFPEHLDWHGGEAQYYKDKANLLAHSRCRILEPNAARQLDGLVDLAEATILSEEKIKTNNAYLDRAHNQSNVLAVLAVTDRLGLDRREALAAMKDFEGLPHRQQELGSINGILYVDDSISTTPQSAIAALETYKDSDVTLIAGGHDRGVDFMPLVTYIADKKIRGVVCMGENGGRLYEALRCAGFERTERATSMKDAVTKAQKMTLYGGVILLSPAASSYDMFKDYIARAAAFADAVE